MVDEAEASWAGHGGSASRPTESAFRYRWKTQAGYLRDLAIYSLRSRLESPDRARKAAWLLFGDGEEAEHGVRWRAGPVRGGQAGRPFSR